MRAHLCTETIGWKGWSSPWCWWFLLKLIDLIIIFAWLKPNLKSRTNISLVLCFLLGQAFFWNLKLLLLLLIYTLFSSKLQKNPKHFRNRLALAYSLTYSAKSWRKRKISMCHFLQIQMFLQNINQILSHWVPILSRKI